MWLLMRSVASVCVSLCPVRARTFENLYLETSFFIIFDICVKSYIKVIGLKSFSQERKISRERN